MIATKLLSLDKRVVTDKNQVYIFHTIGAVACATALFIAAEKGETQVLIIILNLYFKMWRKWLTFAFQAKVGFVSGKKRINSLISAQLALLLWEV